MRSRILLFGADGQIGWEMERSLTLAGDVIAVSRCEADFSQSDMLPEIVESRRPDLIVNAAAYTQVDRAEDQCKLAHRVNCEAVGALAGTAERLGIPVVHFSTDYVFSGDRNRPYQEDDETGPRNVYGRTKLAGEHAVRDSGAKHLIFRTAWIYSARRQNFLLTMLRLSRDEKELRVVDDQFGSPTWAALPAQVLAAVLARHPIDEGAWPDAMSGIYHVTTSGSTSWCGFAREILTRLARLMPERDWPKVHSIPSTEYHTKAVRPAYSVLETKKLANTFGLTLPDWKEPLNRCLKELVASGPHCPEC